MRSDSRRFLHLLFLAVGRVYIDYEKYCKNNYENYGGKRIELRGHRLSRYGIDNYRERLRVGSRREIAYDKVVNRVCHRHKEAGHDTRHYFGHNHLAERLNVVAAEIESRLVYAVVHLRELRQDAEYDRRHAEGYMRKNYRQKAGSKSEEREENHEGDTRHNLGVEYRKVSYVLDEGASLFPHVVYAYGGNRSEKRCRNRRHKSNKESVSECAEDLLVAEKLAVPLKGKARPDSALSLVERESDKHRDRRIEEEEHKEDICFRQKLFHASVSSISSLSN